MIDLYSWPTPNGHKVHLLLEELGLRYRVHPIDIGKGDQFRPDFLEISPNNKIPAIVDPDGPNGEPFSLFESGAILYYLATKHQGFIPKDRHGQMRVLEWLMFQVGGVGPMLGQAHHFRTYAPEKIQYGIERYSREARRLYGVVDNRLEENAFIAGEEYSIADMAIFPWFRGHEGQGIDLVDFPNVKRWFQWIGNRPAVQKALLVLSEDQK